MFIELSYLSTQNFIKISEKCFITFAPPCILFINEIMEFDFCN
jgi:hypothetical protein